MSWLGAAEAVAVLSFDVDAESPILARGVHHSANASVMSHQAFGPLVGVPRILQLLADFELPATFFVPGLTAELHPAVVDRILRAGHEVAHHSHAHRAPVSMSVDEQRRDFDRALAALDALGVRPVGHRAAGWEATWLTARLVAEHGMAYDSSLMSMDRPYWLEWAGGSLIELPVHWSLDDWEQYAFLPDPSIGQLVRRPSQVAAMWKEELDAMRRHGSLFMLCCHPFLSGRASRLEALRTVIEHALEGGKVRFATAADVARDAAEDPSLDRVRHEPPDVDPALYPDEGDHR